MEITIDDLVRNAEMYEDHPIETWNLSNVPFSDLLQQLYLDQKIWKNDLGSYFSENGFEKVGALLEPSECDRLVNLANSIYRDKSYQISDTAYLIRRDELKMPPGKKVYDKKTWQIFNVQDLDSEMNKLFQSGNVEELFRARTNWPVKLQTLTIQVSGAEGRERQPWHIDGYVSPEFKLFIYLTDTIEPKYGPFSVIPGSHRHVMRKWRSRLLNEKYNLHYAQMEREYRDSEGVPLIGNKGDAIVAAMTTVHAGWPLHSEKTRYMIVCSLTTDLNWTGPYKHAAEIIPNP